MVATLVTSEKELDQILSLSLENARDKVGSVEKLSQGFISWTYTPELLKKLHTQHPSVIVKDNDLLAGYALVALKTAASFHSDLEGMIEHLDRISYNGKHLGEYRYYVMGQICVAKPYRSQGVFTLLYNMHRDTFKDRFDFVITEISTANTRSMRAHEKIGFKQIHSYNDNLDEWSVVLWDWS